MATPAFMYKTSGSSICTMNLVPLSGASGGYPPSATILIGANGLANSVLKGPSGAVQLQGMQPIVQTSYATDYNTTNDTLGSRELCSRLIMNNYTGNGLTGGSNFINNILADYPDAYNNIYGNWVNYNYCVQQLSIANSYETSQVKYDESLITPIINEVLCPTPTPNANGLTYVTSGSGALVEGAYPNSSITNSFTASATSNNTLNSLIYCRDNLYSQESKFLSNTPPIIGNGVQFIKSSHTYNIQGQQ